VAKRQLKIETPTTSASVSSSSSSPALALGSPADSQEATADRLTQHYSRFVVPRFEWVDSNESPFSEPILALSVMTRSVKCALVALAAADVASRCESESAEALRYSGIQDVLQDEAVSLLSCDMRRLNADPALFLAQEQQHMFSMLATLFLLTSLGLWVEDESTWMLHLRGAGALLEVWSPELATTSPDLDACLSIIHWLCNLEARACVTRWNPLIQLTRPAASSDCSSSLFSHYAGMVGTIAGLNRQQHRLGRAHSGHRIDEVLAAINTGQARILTQQRALDHSEREDFQAYASLGHLYQQATTIYLYRACMAPEVAASAVALPMERLVEDMQELEDDRISCHSLVWPIFVAATESGGSVDNQQLVLVMLSQALVLNQRRLQRLKAFLNELWSQQGAMGGKMWLTMAREWEQQNRALLIF
jgi:hypothetical protein